ncbi:hypothetical protein N7517_010206 [Penicillium concentricum]|uniref:PIN domain-containing protein n=1 Tax=Penicillium concentricum TaxID=293559 RepID=A0A9W9R8H6_9EURO|nr:uncharacterized protein N7517_010206 [Penicillium concentricum]KAJ5355597.1 hypothetical protein N7517_010206 [Penicillium concentricum]
MSTGRKVFHCAVDETALSTNISEIKKWTANGAIDLVVPLYSEYLFKGDSITAVLAGLTIILRLALERLHALKRAGSQVAINAREAVRFLDRVTSGKDHIAADRVLLQGPMEQYERWEEAEKFFLPEFEEEPEVIDEAATNGEPAIEPSADDTLTKNESDDLSQMLLSKLNFKKDPEAVSITSVGTPSGPGSRTSSRSSRTSPECAQHESSNGTKNDRTKSKSSNHQRTISGTVIPTAPPALRPLLSALLWRLHTGPDAENSAKTCILISNDRATQVWAQKFGIGVKNILQLRTAIQYEEREYKNRCKYVEKTQTQPAEPKTLLSYEEESDEDELRKAAPKAAPPPVEPTATVEVPTKPIDPDSFSRSLGGATKPPTVDASVQQGTAGATGAPRGNAGASRRSSNGRRGGSSRGARGNGRGRGKLWVP